jgi:hydroxypyruvate reductase
LDTSTISDAKAVLEKYGVADSKNISLIETPKEEKYFKRVTNILFLSSRDALVAMLGEALRLGYKTEIVNEQFSGEARDLGKSVAEKLNSATPKNALLYAGESTVTVGKSSGKGGRNQEMTLAALQNIRDGELVLPFASDGHDNTEYAGAIADSTTFAHANSHNLSISEYLNAHNSYNFFSTTGDALITGYTESNVSDLIVALKN